MSIQIGSKILACDIYLLRFRVNQASLTGVKNIESVTLYDTSVPIGVQK